MDVILENSVHSKVTNAQKDSTGSLSLVDSSFKSTALWV